MVFLWKRIKKETTADCHIFIAPLKLVFHYLRNKYSVIFRRFNLTIYNLCYNLVGMKAVEPQSNNVIKGGFFNVSTKPAEPIVESLSNWGTISSALTPSQQSAQAQSTPSTQPNTKPASNK